MHHKILGELEIAYQLVRPKQFPKQIITILPAIYLGRSISVLHLVDIICCFFSFAFLAFTVYIMNDIFDLELDRKHVVKKNRPIASKTVSVTKAIIWAVIFFVISIFLSIFGSSDPLASTGIILFYFFINFIYSHFSLKDDFLIGILLVGLGYPLRFVFGFIYLDLPASTFGPILLLEFSLLILSIKRYRSHLQKRSNTQNRLIQNKDLYLYSANVFIALILITYALFVYEDSLFQIWGTNILIICLIPLTFLLIRILELGIRVADLNKRDFAENFYFDPLVILFSVVIVVILFISRSLQ
jgi:4-hydroxybenzoate polyprenyltransferase